MDRILVKFWMMRFLQILLFVSVVLTIKEYFYSKSFVDNLMTILVWSGLSASFIATLNTYWAYKKRCKLVYKD